MGDEIRIKMLCNVRSDLPFGVKPGTILRAGEEYDGASNRNGAICGICENGEIIGVKPGEFEFLEAPEWLLKIWINYSDSGAETLLKELWKHEYNKTRDYRHGGKIV
jgi:hypothetical protein